MQSVIRVPVLLAGVLILVSWVVPGATIGEQCVSLDGHLLTTNRDFLPHHGDRANLTFSVDHNHGDSIWEDLNFHTNPVNGEGVG